MLEMIEHICENCKHQKTKILSNKSYYSECELGYATFIACQCAGIEDHFEPLRKKERE